MKRKEKILTYVLLLLMLTITSFPIISMVGNSFKANETLLFDSALFPREPTLDNFRYVIERTNFLRYIGNSLIVGLIVTLICTGIACFAGYALSRFRGAGFQTFKGATYAFQLIPTVLILIPLFMIVKTLGLFDSLWSIILCYTAISLPLAIWIIKGFFDTIPRDIEESAFIDGCSRIQSFLRIVLPVSLLSSTFTVPPCSLAMESTSASPSPAVITFNYTWNEYMLSNLFINNDDYRTLTAGLATFVEHNSTQWGYMMAGAVLGTIPALLAIIFAQKYVVQGLSAGAVKG